MTLQPIPSEFPNILGKLDYLFSVLWRAAHLCGQLPTIHAHIDV
jgi:hypothetical protein